ncbi:hypothetical protein K7A41_00240, partial [Sphingobacterium sp. InxBP1]|uniref:hypothetical protein n=1 Tax=Sphingobacterium sp. InxBP1 TaxID=2870328 RepID=UPI00224303FD
MIKKYYLRFFKIFFTVFIVLDCVPNLKAQTPSTSEPDIKSPLDIVQASPTANSLGQYGGVDVGLASGTVNKTIELYNFITGPLQVPLSINYSSNGLKVNDNGGIIGTGWSANLGGVIRRTVMGEDDERSTNRLPSTFNPYAVDDETYNYITGMISYNITASVYDGEPDIFSFNFGNYSGKFIFDGAGNLVLLNYSGLKISRVSQTHFEICTPDGVKYEFGGPAVEYSYKMGSGCGKVFADPTNTAYFLYKITHPDGTTINLLYDAINYTYVTGVNEVYSYRKDNPDGDGPCVSGTPTYSRSNCASIMYTRTYLLKEINSVLGNVQLSYIDHSAQDGKILKDIQIFPKGYTSPVRKVILNYLEKSSTYYPYSVALANRNNLGFRSFLTEIQFVNSVGTIDSKYKFDYKDLNSLPRRFANCQDYFGYFNGKSNTTLIPKPQNEAWASYFSDVNANREPDETYVTAGMLSRIIYPTGGMDSLLYEANTTWREYTIPAPLVNESLTVKGTGTLGTGIQTTSVFTVSFQQKVRFSFFCEILATDGTYPGTGRVILLKNGVQETSQNVQAYNSGSFEVNLLPGNNYQVRVEAGKGDKVSCTVNYSYKSAPDTKAFKNQISAGVRISKVITTENGVSHEKKYSYYDINDVDKKSSGKVNTDPYFEWFTTGKYKCSYSTYYYIGKYYKYTLSSNSIFGDSYYDSAPQYYSDVFEENSQGNGGVIYKFTVNPNSRPYVYKGEDFNAPWTSNAHSNGLEIDRLIFKRNGNIVIPVQRISTSYRSDPTRSNTFKAYVANQRYLSDDFYGESKFTPLDLLEYDHLQRWIYVDSVRTKHYAINGTDYSETIDAFFYDNPVHAQLSRKTRLDSKGKRNVIQYLYPNDYAQGEIFINDMISGKLSGLPVEQVSFVEQGTNRAVISGSLTRYKTGGKGLVDVQLGLDIVNSVPLSNFKFSNRTLGTVPPNGTPTSFSADTRYTNEYQISLYNSNGRPQELKKREEATAVYLWGYGGQYPIAEIRNATYAQVDSVLT